MSEFSQSYHLVSDSADEGVALLRRAELRGWVFAPGNGWVTLIPEPDEFGEASAALLDACTTGTLLYYLNAEDHGWTFTVYRESRAVCAYGCSWEGGLEIEDASLRLDVLEDVVAANLPAQAAEARVALERLLYPASLEHLAAFAEHTDGNNPGHGFAEVMGLEHFHWLSAQYLAAGGDDLAPTTRVN